MDNTKQAIAFDQHEYQLIKQDIQPALNSFIVTFATESVSCIAADETVSSVESGTLLGINAVLQTNSGRAEITTRYGTVYRLENHSFFSIQETVAGIVPVTYGKVFVDRTGSALPAVDQQKYRTSCYFMAQTLITENIDEDSDIYVTLDKAADIFEYDENGKKFQIMHLEPFTKRVLRFADQLQMHQRYTPGTPIDLTDEEIHLYYEKYILPMAWR